MSPEKKKEYNKQYSKNNRDRILENKKRYYEKNKEKIRKKAKDNYDTNKEEFIAKQRKYYSSEKGRAVRLLTKAKQRAKEEGLEFDLSHEDIVIPERCPYLDVPLTHELGQGQLPTNSSIDRIDSSKGYVKGNIQIISRLANTMKSNATHEQLLTFAKNVLALEGQTLTDYTNFFNQFRRD
jgi:hypothetical protein